MGKTLYEKKYVVYKLRAFGLKVSTCPCLLAAAILVADIVAFTMT